MERRPLGATGATVSRLGLGTLTWGRSTGEEDAGQQLRAFVDAGGSLVATADAYGDGASETLLGKLIGDPGLRSELFICTKAGRRHGTTRSVDTSRNWLLEAIDASLARLGVDHVDLWLLEAGDDQTPLDESLGTLAEVVRSGRARYAGLCDLPGWQLASAASRATQPPHHLAIAVAQYEYSLLQRGIEAEAMPACMAYGIGILPWAPLGRGVLTGKYRHGTPPDSRGASESHGPAVRAYLGERHRRVVEGVARAAEGLGVTPAEIAIAWVRDRPGVVAPLMGARTVHQLRTALAGDSLDLPSEIRSALDEVSAPEIGYPAALREGGAWAPATSTES